MSVTDVLCSVAVRARARGDRPQLVKHVAGVSVTDMLCSVAVRARARGDRPQLMKHVAGVM